MEGPLVSFIHGFDLYLQQGESFRFELGLPWGFEKGLLLVGIVAKNQTF